VHDGNSIKDRQPLTPRNIPGTNFCWSLSRTQDHKATVSLDFIRLPFRHSQ